MFHEGKGNLIFSGYNLGQEGSLVQSVGICRGSTLVQMVCRGQKKHPWGQRPHCLGQTPEALWLDFITSHRGPAEEWSLRIPTTSWLVAAYLCLDYLWWPWAAYLHPLAAYFTLRTSRQGVEPRTREKMDYFSPQFINSSVIKMSFDFLSYQYLLFLSMLPAC